MKTLQNLTGKKLQGKLQRKIVKPETFHLQRQLQNPMLKLNHNLNRNLKLPMQLRLISNARNVCKMQQKETHTLHVANIYFATIAFIVE